MVLLGNEGREALLLFYGAKKKEKDSLRTDGNQNEWEDYQV